MFMLNAVSSFRTWPISNTIFSGIVSVIRYQQNISMKTHFIKQSTLNPMPPFLEYSDQQEHVNCMFLSRNPAFGQSLAYIIHIIYHSYMHHISV